MQEVGGMVAASGVPRVLVFDDNPAIAAKIERDVLDAGFEARMTADVSRIIPLAEEFRPDVGVLDIKIDYGSADPDASVDPSDGIVAFAKIRSLLPFVEAVFVTAFSDVEEYTARARRFEAVVLPKPYTKHDLAQSIRDKFAISRNRRLDEWLRLAEIAEGKGVNPDQVLDLMTDIVAAYNVSGADQGGIDSEGIAAALAITDIVARNRDLVPDLVRLFGADMPGLAKLLKRSPMIGAWETAKKFEEGAADLARDLREWENG